MASFIASFWPQVPVSANAASVLTRTGKRMATWAAVPAIMTLVWSLMSVVPWAQVVGAVLQTLQSISAIEVLASNAYFPAGYLLALLVLSLMVYLRSIVLMGDLLNK